MAPAENNLPPSNDLNVAIIGSGTQGLILMEDAVKIPGVRFRAVCDIWPYSQKYGAGRLKGWKQEANVYADYQDMLAKEKDLQAVIVATPDWVHAEHSIACLKAGLHVYCADPMSNNLAQARQMVLASRQAGRLLQIGHKRRSLPRYQYYRDKLLGEAKLAGRITHAYGQWHCPASMSAPRSWAKGTTLDEATLKKYGYDTMERFRDWRWYRKFGGGLLADLGESQIDVLTWFLGARPRSVMASGGVNSFTENGRDCPDNVLAIFEFDTPEGVVRAHYQIISTNTSGGYYESIMGMNGTLQVSLDPGKCRLYPEEPIGWNPYEHPWQPWIDNKTVALMQEGINQESHPFFKTLPPRASFYIGPTELVQYPLYGLPNIPVETSYTRPHLQNFFDTIRGKAKLNCSGEVGYATAVQVLRIYDAMAARERLTFKEEDFQV
jgi:predicted dehydrogenase